MSKTPSRPWGPARLLRAALFGFVAALAPAPALAQAELPTTAASLEDARQAAERAGVLESQLRQCTQDCEALRELLDELRAYGDELEAARSAMAALVVLRAEAQEERAAVERVRDETSLDQAQRMATAEIELLDREVRIQAGKLETRQEAVEKERAELNRLRRQQEVLKSDLAGLDGPARQAGGHELLEERRNLARKLGDLAGQRFKQAVERLELEQERLAMAAELLERLNSRLSGARLSRGIPPEELERSRARLEQLRLDAAERSAQLQPQLEQLEENLQSVGQKLVAAEAERAALDMARPAAAASAETEAWMRRRGAADDAVEEARIQLEALRAARDYAREYGNLGEFLLDQQNMKLRHSEDFNRLLALVHERAADVEAVEAGLARFRERQAALTTEMQAFEMSSDRLRNELGRTAEQIRHTALRHEAALRDAETAGGTDELLNARVNTFEDLLNRLQAINESISSRRSLLEEALLAARDQLKNYQDSLHLLESYFSGALRFNWSTLEQTGDWLRESAGAAGREIRQLPARWSALRLWLEDPARRDRAITSALWLGAAALALGLMDLMLASTLRRKRRKLGIRSRAGWLMTGPSEETLSGPAQMFPGPFTMPRPAAPEARKLPLRMAIYALSRLHRPMAVTAFFLFGAWAVPEARGVLVAGAILALLVLLRRAGSVLVTLLFSRDPELPSLRLAPDHAPLVLRWSYWVLLLWPPLLAVYAAVLAFEAPVHVRLTAGLLAFSAGLLLLLPPLVHGRAAVIRLIRVQSAREKPSLPVLFYNRLIGQLYLGALLALLLIVGLYGAGYEQTARRLGVAFAATAAVVGVVALLVRGLHHWYRRSIAGNPLWGALGSPMLHLLEAAFAIAALLAILVVWGVDITEVWQKLQLQLEREVFQTADGRSVTLLTLVWVLGLLVAVAWLSRRFRELLQTSVYPYLSIDRGQQLSLNLVVHYGLLLIAALVGLNMLGINLTTLRVVLGAIGLGVGFGLQTIVNNFVSGVILLVERNIRPDDVIDFGGERVRVEEVRARCTIVTNKDNKTMIVPNVRFMNETITNWTQNGSSVRDKIHFFVAPEVDQTRLHDVVAAWASSHPDILREPGPELRMLEIQRGYLHVALYYFHEQPWRAGWERSKLSYDLLAKLKAERFELPPPAQNVFFPNVEMEALNRISQVWAEQGVQEAREPRP